MHALRVGIIGGSIAGCSAAILLNRAGHNVEVFERSDRGLVGRGGGIGTPGSVLQSLIAEDVVDAAIPHLTGTSMPFIIRTAAEEHLGYIPWEIPIDLSTFHWSSLWNELRKRVPDSTYHRGHEVTDASTDADGTVSLVFKNGSQASFDLVLFADGYQSLGRKMLFPEVDLNYRGYMLWRGLLPESEIGDGAPMGSNVPRLSYTSLPGNFVVYFVPGEDGSVKEGERLYNWAAYIPVPEADLPEFMIDRHGRPHTGSIPPGTMRQGEEDRLKQLMRDNLPTYYGDIVAKTQNTYVQLIYTVAIPAYSQGRIALIGDAGMVAPPFTGSGVFKGYNNVKDLLDVLAASDTTVEEALQQWSEEQVKRGNRLLALGEQMEQAFIWSSLNLATADAETTKAWWRAAVTFPEDFTYEADDR